jgi:hypothetical protein
MKASSVCPACGAALAPDAERCDLCGTMLGAPEPVASPEPASALVEATQPPPLVAPAASEPTACGLCGHLNPAGARFCNQCGATLVSARAASPEPLPPAVSSRTPAEAPLVGPAPVVLPEEAASPGSGRPSSEPGRRALLLVGGGLLAVLALYVITQSSQRGTPAPEATAPAEAPRLTGAAEALPDSLRDRVAVLEDQGTAQSLDQAAGLLYRSAAARAPEDPQRGVLAQQAVDLYERSLALEDNPDVRVNLAVAALLDPRDPMRGVQELQAVLNAHPDHVEANFNMGLMRMQIGRLDAAAESFRRVIALTPPDDPVHRRASEALAAVEGAMAQQGTGA